MRHPPHPWRAPALALLTLSALALRLIFLDAQPLWWDEGYSIYLATESLPRLLSLTSVDIHPPLYYLLLQGWFALVGTGAIEARLLGVLIGTLTIPLAWWAARLLVGGRLALLVAGLFALSPFHIYYSQEVRMYALMTALALLTVALWRQRAWGAAALAALAGLYTQYYFLLLLAAIALLVLREIRAGRLEPTGPLRAAVVVVVGYLPWLVYAGLRLSRYVESKLVIEGDSPLSPLVFVPRHLAAWSLGHATPGFEWVQWGSVILVGLALVGIVETNRHPERERRLTLWLWLIPAVGVFVVGLALPFVDPRIERQLLFVLPFYLMLVAQGLGALWRRWSLLTAPLLAGVILLDVVALAAFYTVPRYPDEDYRPLLEEVGAARAPDDGWLAIYDWQIGYLRAYLPEGAPEPLLAERVWAEDAGALERAVALALEAHPRVWLPAYQVKGRLFEEQLVESLSERGVEAWNEWYGNSRLYLFGAAADRLPEPTPVGELEQVGTLRVALDSRDVESGVGIVPLLLEVEWYREGLRASVQLVRGGWVWGEWDGELGAAVTRAGLRVDAGTPPGEATVRVTLYREGESRPLDRLEDGRRVAPEIAVGAVEIVRPNAPLPDDALTRRATHPVPRELDGVRLLGISLARTQYLQGETLPLTLFWRVDRPPDRALVEFVQLQDASRRVVAAREGPPVDGLFPATAWRADDLLRDPAPLTIPADLAPGSYRLVAGLFDPATGSRLTDRAGADQIELVTLEVAARDRILEPPPLGEPLDLSFGERARLAGIRRPATLAPGGTLEVDLVWEATSTSGGPLRAFVQLFRDDEQVDVSDHPIEPPAPAWVSGEWIIDRHQLVIPAPLPPGEYRLLAGLRDPDSGTRLTTPEGDAPELVRWRID